MSSTSDSSLPESSGYQERATQSPHVPVTRPQSEVVLMVQSVLTTGQYTEDQPDLCQHFAEFCTNIREWTNIDNGNAKA